MSRVWAINQQPHMKIKCFRADRESQCAQCSSRIYPGDDVAWTQITVRSHRDGAGRAWDKSANRVRHWVCPQNTIHAAWARAEQISDFEILTQDFPENQFFADALLAVRSV